MLDLQQQRKTMATTTPMMTRIAAPTPIPITASTGSTLKRRTRCEKWEAVRFAADKECLVYSLHLSGTAWTVGLFIVRPPWLLSV